MPAGPVRHGLVLLAALALGGCGEAGGDDGRVAFSPVEVQAYLEQEVARTLPGLSVTAATCPPELPDRPGRMATCTVVVEQVTLQYEVERLVADRFEARPKRPIALVSDIAGAVRAKLGTEAAEVSCGGAPVVQPPAGEGAPCEITGAGPPRTVSVQVGPGGAIVVSD